MKLDAELPMDVDTGSNAAQTHGNGAPPAAASFVWHTRPDGNVDLPPAGAAVDDADDPEEDDVNMMLQVEEEEVDDDVTAVGGDIMGVGPTWGTTAGDPTSNLGRLGADLLQQLAGDDDDKQGSSRAAGHTFSDEQPSIVIPDSSTAAAASMQQPSAAPAPAATAQDDDDGGVSFRSSKRQAVAAVSGWQPKSVPVVGRYLSEGDADVRGIGGQVVHEDADGLPLGFSRAGVAADEAAAVGPDGGQAEGVAAAGRAGVLGGEGGVDMGAEGDEAAGRGAAAGATAAVGTSGGGVDGFGFDTLLLSGGVEYGPDEIDGLEPGAVGVGEGGDFEPTSYVRHRSQGQARIDPDPRDRPDPDPAGGLRSLLQTTPEAAGAVAAIEGLQGAAGGPLTVVTNEAQQAVLMGGAETGGGAAGGGGSGAAAAAAARAVLRDVGGSSSHPVDKSDFGMGGLAMPALTDNALVVTDYTEEPKYAAEVNEAEQVAEVEAAGGGGGGGVSNRNEGVGVPLGSGRPQVLSDARHLDAIFAPPSAGMQ